MIIEYLESRRLFAAAPPTILGISVDVNVTSGADPLASSGKFTLEVGSLARNYKIIGTVGVADSEGSYAYRVVKPNVGELKLNDSLGGEITADLKFLTSTKGTVSVSRAAGGSQTGIFVLSGPDFAFIQGKVLIVRGTTDGDAIGVSLSGEHDVSVTRNNITQDFDEFEGDACIVTSDAGNDTIDTTTMNFPTYVDGGAGNDSIVSD